MRVALSGSRLDMSSLEAKCSRIGCRAATALATGHTTWQIEGTPWNSGVRSAIMAA